MSNSFASLLRHSRLASYDRTLSQVYTTPLKHKKIGDWGLKRNLPTVIRTRYATIDSLDTAEHQTPWQSGNSQVLFVKRWKENFPHSKRPAPRSDSITYNVAKMTPADFRQFLKQCVHLAPEFQTLLAKKQIVPEQVFEFLKVAFTDSPSESIVGPTYSDIEVEPGYPVEGRILNHDGNGHAVGVGGVVAFLPRRSSVHLRQKGDRHVRTFFVESASIDEEGKPRVVLSATRPGSGSNLSLPLEFEALERDTSPMFTMTTENMFLTRKRSIEIAKDDDDRVQANPDHEKLMSRISSLITNTQQK
ncbi:hypothetical protein A0J61_07795 [Choanephora cucurbitarum]|uniref:37S ribosomal protein mrp51, mitochondrial n=1 Tax=Choanephora cucurbitarum TaxID=101091 RepID=A0A1C7N4U4_9FUNG|nr:hypothetical protein A0J61_07795 [Choanephora cucurbitarum]